jgi:hypothetical protein
MKGHELQLCGGFAETAKEPSGCLYIFERITNAGDQGLAEDHIDIMLHQQRSIR